MRSLDYAITARGVSRWDATADEDGGIAVVRRDAESDVRVGTTDGSSRGMELAFPMDFSFFGVYASSIDCHHYKVYPRETSFSLHSPFTMLDTPNIMQVYCSW